MILKLFLGTDKAYLWLLANHVYEVQLLIFFVCMYINLRTKLEPLLDSTEPCIHGESIITDKKKHLI